MAKLAETVYIEGCKTEVELFGNRPAMELVDRNLDLLATINKIFKENELEELIGVKKVGGSDSAQVTSAGIPCLDNFGVIGGGIHSPDEYAYLESLKTSAKYLASAIFCM